MSAGDTYSQFERQILACAMQGEDLSQFVGLPTDAWGSTRHRDIHIAICKTFLDGDLPNEINVLKKLGTLGCAYITLEELMEMTSAWVPMGQLPHLCEQLAEQANHRRVVSAVHSALQIAQDADSAEAAKECAVGRILSMEEVDLKTRLFGFGESLAQLRDESLEAFQRPEDEKSKPAGISSGVDTLDMILGGFLKGSVYVLGAGTGRGKSVMGLQFALAAASEGSKVVYVSLEMSHVDLTRRAVASKSGVNPGKIKSGRLGERDLTAMTDAFAWLARLRDNITIYDQPGLSLYQLAASIQQIRQSQGVDLVIVDYLQLIRIDEGHSREREVATISSGLVALARSHDVPLIAISQLNQDGRIRESRAVEHDAAAVMKIVYPEDNWKEGGEPVDCELSVVKHRHGRTGRVPLTFMRSEQRFVERDFSSFRG